MNMQNLNDKGTLNIKAIGIYTLTAFFLIFEMAVQVSPGAMSSDLMSDLSIGTFDLGILSGVYFYTYTAMQIPAGLLFDRFNPRMIIAGAVIMCSLGVILFGLSSNFFIICFARLLMGCGSSFAFVSVLVVASDLFQRKYFALLTGITQALAALGAMAGQYPIHVAVGYLGWRYTMIFIGIVGIFLACIVWRFVTYKKPNKNFQSNTTKKTIARISDDLMIIVKSKQNWFIAGYACLLWAPMSGFASLWGIPFLLHVDHLTISTAALTISMMWIGLALGSPVFGIVSKLLNNNMFALRFCALMGVLSFIFVLEIRLPSYICGLLLFFSGAACSGQALSFALVEKNNEYAVRSTAIAFNNMAVVISGAVFQPVIGKLIEYYEFAKIHSAYQIGCSIILIAYIVGFIISVFLIKEKFIVKFYQDKTSHVFM